MGAPANGSNGSLVWVNAMRLKESQRHQFLYAPPKDEYDTLRRIADGHGGAARLSRTDCADLNKLSVKIHQQMRDQGFRAMCDFCDTQHATRELSKQTVVPFREAHLMRANTDLEEFRRYGRPELTFHDQLWSCCSSKECFMRAEQEQQAEVADPAVRQVTGLATCQACHAAPGKLRCARCRTAVYCSKECQRSAWRAHKHICKAAAGTSVRCQSAASGPERPTTSTSAEAAATTAARAG
tara:strand:- start:239 stop:958 length:720 start_codon:yes stop_codon:yes gene_type:complete